jgi:hypothetical protein
MRWIERQLPEGGEVFLDHLGWFVADGRPKDITPDIQLHPASFPPDVVARFRVFYEQRAHAGLKVERETMRMARVLEMSDADVQNLIVSMPLRKFQQRRYLEYARDLAWLRFNPDLWKQCSDADLAHVLHHQRVAQIGPQADRPQPVHRMRLAAGDVGHVCRFVTAGTGD